jgi:hypothetical protein
MPLHFATPNPLVALGVLTCTAGTDAVYVMFTAAVAARRRTVAASWSSVWYLLSAFAVISYTGNAAYVIFAALGSWIGAFGAVTWLVKKTDPARTAAGPTGATRPPSTSLH